MSWHIALMPSEKNEPGAADSIAGILKLDVYQARRLLSGTLPKLIAHFNSQEEAEMVAGSLGSFGLAVFTCEDSIVRRPPPVNFHPVTLRFEPGKITFTSQSQSVKVCESKDVFLLIKGNRSHVTEVEETKTTRKLSVGKTLLTGGIPVFNKVKEKTLTTTTETEQFLRVYSNTAMDPVLEIRQNGMDYKFLGVKLNYSSLVNFSSTVSDVKNNFPAAYFDNRLTGLKMENSGEKEFELDCRLLWLYYKSLKSEA